MLLVLPKCQLPRHDLYINDGVLLLDFLKSDNWSKEEREKIRERFVNFCQKELTNLGICFALQEKQQ